MTNTADLLDNADLKGFYHIHASVFVVQLTTLQDFSPFGELQAQVTLGIFLTGTHGNVMPREYTFVLFINVSFILRGNPADLLDNVDLMGFYHYIQASVFVVQLTALQDFSPFGDLQNQVTVRLFLTGTHGYVMPRNITR